MCLHLRAGTLGRIFYMSLDLTGSLSSGSDNLTDDIADSIGDAVASLVKTAFKSFLGS